MPDTLGLLQLADACFPSGGFAFSSGLESLAKLGYVKRMEDFHQYLDCHLDQLTSAEIPFLNSAYEAAAPEAFASEAMDERPGTARFPVTGFREVVREWDAWLFMPAQRRASLSQGQAWSRAMEEAFDLPAVRAVRSGFSRAGSARQGLPGQGLALHFLMVFAATLRAAGVSRPDAQSLLLHMSLRDQLGAAVRMGLLGSLQAQKLHRRFIEVAEEYRRARKDLDHTLAMRGAHMIDLGQASHPYLYSKLFQS